MKMQAFRDWLFSVKPSQDYQRQLEGITRFSRNRLVDVASQLTWDIWNAGPAANNA